MRSLALLVFASLSLGIAAGDAWEVSAAVWLSAGGAAAAAAWVAPRGRLALAGIAWFAGGGALAVPQGRAPPVPAALAAHDAPVRFTGELAEPPVRAYGRTHLVLELARVELDGRWRPLRARVGLTVGGLARDLTLGDTVHGRARFRPPRILANPGAPDAARRLRYAGISMTGVAAHPESVVRQGDTGTGGIWPALDGLRVSLLGRIGSGAFGEGPLLAGFFLGDRGGLLRADRDAFTVAGLSHTLAVSGQHLVVVAFLLFRLLAALLARCEPVAVRIAPQRPAALVTLVVAAGYTLLVGAPYSALRALAMASLLLAGVMLGRSSLRSDALWIGAAALLCASPGALFEPAFQLSVLAVVGLLWLAPWLHARLVPRLDPLVPATRRVRAWGWIAGLLAATASATALTAPLVAYHFQMFTPLGLLASLVVVPLLELWILPLCLAAALFCGLGDGLWAAAELGAVGVRLTLDGISALEGAATAVAPPTALELVLLTALALCLPLVTRRPGRWLAAGLALALAGSLGAGALSRRLGDSLRITFLSVGHGDAAIVQAPGGRAMLIDGGGSVHGDFDIGRRVVAPALRALGVSRLDAVVLSHPHPDHARGLAHVVEAFPVGELWYGGRPFGRGAAELEAAVRSRGIPLRVFRKDESPAPWGEVHFEVLHPRPGDAEPYYPELGENDNSLVLALSFRRFRVLFPGDLEAEGEEVLVGSGRLGRHAVLKSPHHGSRTSSTAAFLEAVSPRVVVYSVGERNAYGFPHPGVRRRVAALQAAEFRTDLDGAIEISTDGHKARVRASRSGREEVFELP
jgi:competence protein ComEC